MGREVAITLTDEQETQLENLARVTKESAEQIVQRAVRYMLDQEAAFRAEVQIGIDEANAGNVRDFQEVAAELRVKLEQRLRDAGH